MRARLLFVFVASAGLIAGSSGWEPSLEADALTATMLNGAGSEICLMPPEPAAYSQVRGGGAGLDLGLRKERTDLPPWPAEGVLGGDIMPLRNVYDPYPTYDGVVIDPRIGRAFFTDSSLSTVLSYDTSAGSYSDNITEPKTHILGPDTGLGFTTGIALDTERREIYAVNNDGGGVAIFNYDDSGAVKFVRKLETPHQSWGISINIPRDEVAVTAQQLHGVVIYKRGAKELEPPIRVIRGYATGLADPHGVEIDDERDEIVVANHGNWTELRPYSPYDPLSKDPPSYQEGRFEAPSIRVYSAAANGDVAPLRSVTGALTGLNWPMGVEVDKERDDIIVANYGDDSVRIFKRGATGDLAPARVIKGDRTHIRGPVDVSVDTKMNELWVANYADHTALVFDRDANGNVAPKRIVRNGPKGAATLAFTNASAAAYDSKRDALIVPN